MPSHVLAEGEIDALHTARIPSTFESRPGTVRRLFENYVEVERAYYQRTQIYPIMHTVALRRDVYEANRWIAQSLCKAFAEAKWPVYGNLYTTSALTTRLPWQTAQVEDVRREMGHDGWSYGFAPNRYVLDTFLRCRDEQRLSKRRMQPEELFAPETLEGFAPRTQAARTRHQGPPSRGIKRRAAARMPSRSARPRTAIQKKAPIPAAISRRRPTLSMGAALSEAGR